MNNIKLFAAMLLSSLAFSSMVQAQEIDKVPDCATGQALIVHSNGWLASDDSAYVASHHEILADYRQPGIPDAVFHKADHESRQIGVCKVFNKLHYFVK